MRLLGGVLVLMVLAACAPGPTPTPGATGSPTQPQSTPQQPTGAATPATHAPQPTSTGLQASEAGTPEATAGAPTSLPPPLEEESVEEMPPITAGTGPVRTEPPPRPHEAEPTLAPMTTPPARGRREVARMTIDDAGSIPDVTYAMGEVEAGGQLRVEAQCQSPQPLLHVQVRRGEVELDILEIPCAYEQGMRSSTTVGQASEGAAPVFLELVPDPDAPLAVGTSAWVRVLRD